MPEAESPLHAEQVSEKVSVSQEARLDSTEESKVQATEGYTQIFRSTALMGGSQSLVLLVGIVQTKFLAVLLGPAGIGLAAALTATLNLVSKFTGFGIAGSGVRELAKTDAEDSEAFGRVVSTVRLLSWGIGLVGTLIVFVFATRLSVLTFGSDEYAVHLRILSVVLFIRAQISVSTVVIRGKRKVASIAKMEVLASLFSLAVAVPVYGLYGIDGIVAVIVANALARMAISGYFARSLFQGGFFQSRDVFGENAKRLLSLGFAIMWTGILSMAVAYLTRMLIARDLGLASVGQFQSAFKISGMFVNFVLGAMATDFLPQLSAVSEDHRQSNALVNQQTEIGILLSIPGIIGMLALAPLVIWLFYSSAFTESVSLIRWFIIGCGLRVLSWPMGIMILAQGKKKLLVVYETLGTAIHVGLIVLLLQTHDLQGVAYAFVIFNFFHLITMLFVASHLTRFRWSIETIRLVFVSVLAAVVVVVLIMSTTRTMSSVAGAIVAGLLAVWSLRELSIRLGQSHKAVRFLRGLPIVGHVVG